MKRGLARSGRPSPFVPAVLGLGLLLVLVPFAVAACGTGTGVRATVGYGPSTTSPIPAPSTTVVIDTGYTTTSTTPASVPALGSGITPEQVLQLVASWSNVPAEDWEVRDSKNLGDWAVANLYTGQLSEQMDERGVGAVFEKRSGAWFFEGWVSVSDPSNQPVELTNMGAPEAVWTYFGLEPTSRTTRQSALPEQMPANFGFIAAYGVGAKNQLDTFKGTFTKDLIAAFPHTATADLRLTPAEMNELYRRLCGMDIVTYPSEIPPSAAPIPHLSYYLFLCAGGAGEGDQSGGRE